MSREIKKQKTENSPSSLAAGFTIVELLIATAIFSVILLLVTTGMLQISRTYYKGINTAKTQEAARTIMDEVSRAIQFGGGVVEPTVGSPTSDRFCVGQKRYSFLLNTVQSDTPAAGQSKNVLVVDDWGGPTCTPQSLGGGLSATSRELLSPNMRLARFTVTPAGGDLWAIELRVVYGAQDLSLGGSCSGGAGGQFCAASELRTIVKKRVK